MEHYEQLTSEEKARVLDTLVCASELFTTENLHFLSEAITLHHKQASKPAPTKKTRVDIFDFEHYKKEYQIMSVFYTGLELHLRTAILLDYKYNHLAAPDRHILELTLSKKTGKVLLVRTTEEGKRVGKPVSKKYLSDFTNVFEPYHLLKQWYKHYQPAKLEKENFLEQALSKYAGHEDVAFNKMYKIYVDGAWQTRPLWFSADFRITPQGKKQSMQEFYAKYNQTHKD